MRPTSTPLDRIGVGIDTARYGHRVWFLRPDLRPAARPLTVTENQQGYQALQERLEHLHQQYPAARLHIRIDAAGQYANNLVYFLRQLDLPTTISIGEPKRNKDYQKAHFPKRTTDDTESQAMARFAVVEQPAASTAIPPPFQTLCEIASRLQAQVKQSTQAVNRLHNLMARAFPELAALVNDFSARWVLRLLDKYPTAERLAHAHLRSLQCLPYLSKERAAALRQAAKESVAALRGDLADTLVRQQVTQVCHCLTQEEKLRQMLEQAFEQLPPGGHQQLPTIPGIGKATAAVLTAKIIDIDRFATPQRLVGYFGLFPEENTSGVDKGGRPLPPGTLRISHKGNDLVRGYLWNAARVAIQHNPAVRALYRRLRAKGRRGDVALGHAMRKLLHLVCAVWKSNQPFDKNHFDWEATADKGLSPTAAAETDEHDKTAVGHTQDVPAQQVVTTATSTVGDDATPVNPTPPPRPYVDFAFLREQITIAEVLQHLGLLREMSRHGQQRRGRCPVHTQPGSKERTFSVHVGKNIFQCFQADCGIHGNVLDLWAAVHNLPLYEAALHLAGTFALKRNREEEPV